MNSSSLLEAGYACNAFTQRLTEASRNVYFNLTLSHSECSAIAFAGHQQSTQLPYIETISALAGKGLVYLKDDKWNLSFIGQSVLNLLNMANVDIHRVSGGTEENEQFLRAVKNTGFTLSLSKAQVRAFWEIWETKGSTADIETIEALISKGFITRVQEPGKPQIMLTMAGYILHDMLVFTGMRGE